MRLPRNITTSSIKTGAALCLMGMLAGCDTKDFLNPTAIVRSGHPAEPLVVPILSTIDAQVENGPADFASATPPIPADMVSSSNDYTIGRNDLLNIAISDLMGPGQETIKTARVSESGNVSLPYLGVVHAAGLTEFELE
ncbi:MAG TPA: polysaccharide biosynthesis/export family protein, partial [Humisphaera sp.]|nr:polysaccharide biosynthesis/export family protein [Humisphaera sp.]